MLQFLKGIGEEAKKKFTFRTHLLYIEDSYLFEDKVEYDHVKRIQSMRDNIKSSLDYTNFKAYYSLLENVGLDANFVAQ